MYNNEMTKYRLNGLIQHLGHSVNSGHYIAAMRGFDGQSWFKYDDESVSVVDFSKCKFYQPLLGE
jgi:ubiquitin C-terminal hydrolase